MSVNSITALAACLFLLASCEKNGDEEGACGAGFAEDVSQFTRTAYSDFQPYTGRPVPGQLYYHKIVGLPSKTLHFTGFTAKPVCTNEHMKINYEIVIANEPQTLSMKIFGDAYWSAFSDKVILFEGIPTPGQSYKGSLTIGLKQAFPQGGGDVDAFVNVEFTTSGNYALDSAYFLKHVHAMIVSSRYSKF